MKIIHKKIIEVTDDIKVEYELRSVYLNGKPWAVDNIVLTFNENIVTYHTFENVYTVAERFYTEEEHFEALNELKTKVDIYGHYFAIDWYLENIPCQFLACEPEKISYDKKETASYLTQKFLLDSDMSQTIGHYVDHDAVMECFEEPVTYKFNGVDRSIYVYSSRAFNCYYIYDEKIQK